ncbi:MAG: hypothetical protein OXK74_18210 [Gemmatimonadota bacterium]|nr:hypothetical protein [Gemmatimonadota bacterium]
MTTAPSSYPTLFTALLAGTALAACGYGDAADPADTAAAAMSLETFTEAVRTLSSDEFEGRAPSTPGEELTVDYLVDKFQAAGLEPGNGDSFFQSVPLVALTEQGQPELTIRAGDGRLDYAWPEDFVAWTKRVVENESITDSEMVFVGYGIVAPEYGWNDYEGVDAAGKTVVMLVNDPGFATQDSAVFRGNAMTYYGRWTYKFEEAARQGAAGAIVVHEEAAAGYPCRSCEAAGRARSSTRPGRAATCTGFRSRPGCRGTWRARSSRGPDTTTTRWRGRPPSPASAPFPSGPRRRSRSPSASSARSRITSSPCFRGASARTK